MSEPNTDKKELQEKQEEYEDNLEMLQQRWFDGRVDPPTDASDPEELDEFLKMLEDVSELGREYRIHAMDVMDNE